MIKFEASSGLTGTYEELLQPSQIASWSNVGISYIQSAVNSVALDGSGTTDVFVQNAWSVNRPANTALLNVMLYRTTTSGSCWNPMVVRQTAVPSGMTDGFTAFMPCYAGTNGKMDASEFSVVCTYITNTGATTTPGVVSIPYDKGTAYLMPNYLKDSIAWLTVPQPALAAKASSSVEVKIPNGSLIMGAYIQQSGSNWWPANWCFFSRASAFPDDTLKIEFRNCLWNTAVVAGGCTLYIAYMKGVGLL